MTLRIALIAHNLRAGGGISVGRNLIAALGRVAPEHSYFVSIPAGLGYEPVCRSLRSCCTLSLAQHTPLARLRFDAIRLPSALVAFRPQVTFALGNIAVLRASSPQALLCQDSHLWYPARHFPEGGPAALRTRAIRAAKRALFRRSLSRAALVYCQTETAIRRLKAAYHYAGPIRLCPNAVTSFAPLSAGAIPVPASLAEHTGAVKLFCLSRYYPHKNMEALVALFARHRQELAGHRLILTLSPDHGPRAVRLLASIHEHGLQDQIINVGPLPQTDLEAYYAHCHALILPTLLESFSATYIEAMHFGCPILTSDLDFAHEICGDAALYFDPWSTESILHTIEQLPMHPDLAERGRARLKQHFRTWDEIAADVLEGLYSIARSD